MEWLWRLLRCLGSLWPKWDTSDETDASPEPDEDSAKRQAELLKDHNFLRRELGLRILVFDNRLYWAAQRHSEWMAINNQLDHRGKDGSRLSDRVKAEDYPFGGVGENIASGQRTVYDVMRGWLGSPKHKANLLNPDWQHAGFGVRRSVSGRWYWCAVFARPRRRNQLHALAVVPEGLDS